MSGKIDFKDLIAFDIARMNNCINAEMMLIAKYWHSNVIFPGEWVAEIHRLWKDYNCNFEEFKFDETVLKFLI